MARTRERTLARIVDDARAAVAAGRELDAEALRARVREACAGDEEAERGALERLERVLAVQRARTRLATQGAPRRAAAPGRPRRPGALRTRPTITGNMDVRRGAGAEPALAWDVAADVVEWELRISERPDPRRDYVVRETTVLDASATEVALALGEQPLRVHLLGRGRTGQLVRRAIVSGLTSENWRDRWQRRATAA